MARRQPDEGQREIGIPGERPQQLIDAQAILGGALSTAFAAEFRPEALITVGGDPWKEIARVARSVRHMDLKKAPSVSSLMTNRRSCAA